MSHTSAAAAVLKGLVAALNVAGMTGCLSSETGATVTVTNDWAQAGAPPAVVVTIAHEARLDAMTAAGAGKSVLAELHYFSDYQGDRENLLIHSKAIELLHYQAIVLDGHVLIACQFEELLDIGVEEIQGVKRRHHAGLFRVDAKQVAA